MTNDPLVSIGMPVYNGEPYLRHALESILAQTYRNIEVVISDNASTDGTAEICQYYAERDDRIRYYRNEINLGGPPNFNRTFELASGDYFKWAACDDVCHPHFLQRCVQALEEDPSLVLAYPRAVDIGEDGKVITARRFNLRGYSPRPSERFRYEICANHWCFHVFGVIRAELLRKTRLIEKYVSSDAVLLAHLSLLGRSYEVPENLFFHRQHELRAMKQHLTMQSRVIWFNPELVGRLSFPSWRLFLEYWLSLFRSPLPRYELLVCHFHLLRWLRHHWPELAADVKHALIRT